MLSKKKFFKKHTVNQILKDREVYEKNNNAWLAGAIDSIDTNEAIIFSGNIVPVKYIEGTHEGQPSRRTQISHNFLKHGPEVKLRRHYTLQNAIEDGKTPHEMIKNAFEENRHKIACGYSFVPNGKDKRKRIVSLVECLEGAKLFHYANNSSASIDIKNYNNMNKAARIATEGATAVVGVPSRTPDQGKHNLTLTSIATRDTEGKFGIWQGIASNDSCGHQLFNFGYNKEEDIESSNVYRPDAHEVAAYLQIANTLEKDGNIIPTQMSPFAIPSEDLMKFYDKLNNNVVINYVSGSNHKMAPLNKAEKEILLWGYVSSHKHEDAFETKNKIAMYDL